MSGTSIIAQIFVPLNDRVIAPFREDSIFTKLRKFPNLQYVDLDQLLFLETS